MAGRNNTGMRANIKWALAQLNKAWRAFEHNGHKLTKSEVHALLTYGISRGYEHTGQITDAEVERIVPRLATTQQPVP